MTVGRANAWNPVLAKEEETLPVASSDFNNAEALILLEESKHDLLCFDHVSGTIFYFFVGIAIKGFLGIWIRSGVFL